MLCGVDDLWIDAITPLLLQPGDKGWMMDSYWFSLK